MGNEEDRFALIAEVLHDRHQFLDLLRRQHGCRLVEDQDFIVPVKHLEDLGALLHADRDVLDLCIRVDAEAVLVRQGHDFLPGLVLLKEAPPRRLNAQDDVFKYREALDQFKMLVDHADAEIIGIIRVHDLNRLSVLADLPHFSLIEAKEDAHQSGFSGAVLTQQRVDLATLQLKCDVVVGDDARKHFCDVKHLNCIWCLRQTAHPFLLL